MKDLAICVNNVSKIYKLYNKPLDRVKESLGFSKKKYHIEHYSLDDISFGIEKGDIVGIIGENGAGKSTLLKIITGVLTPTSGDIIVDGKISALLELGAGFNPEYTGVENIYLSGAVMGFTKEEIDMKLKSIIEFADIGEFIEQPVKTYSSGMFVRLAFSVAISIEPDILIVDEALSVGDAYFQSKSMTKMKDLFNMGKTVLFVTHDTSTVKSLCKKAIYLENGKLLKYGIASDVVDFYEKKVRDRMLNQPEVSPVESIVKVEEFSTKKEIKFDWNPNFMSRVEKFRQGIGNAKVVNVEILNKDEKLINDIEFNQEVRIRLYVYFEKECTVCVGYHIRDNKNIEILGSNTVFEGIGEINGKEGDKLIVTFSTKLPLIEGMYNISTVLSKVVIMNVSANFQDYTQDGVIFRMLENSNCKIWNKVYINNSVELIRK